MNRGATSAENHRDKTEKIGDPARIASLLLRAMEERALLTVNTPNPAEAYNSALREVRPEEGYLELREFKPQPGQSSALDKLRISANLGGVEISFATRIKSVSKRDGIAFYRVQYPVSLNYLQRRSHYRAKISLARSIKVTLLLDDGRKRIEGKLRDISVSGISASFPPDLPDLHADDPRALDCSIALPTGETVDCYIEICFVKHSPKENVHIVGARFVQMGPLHQSFVARFVTALDRETMKKRITFK